MNARPTRPVRPLTAVLESFGLGATSVQDVADRTGLPRDVVSGAVDHLVRLGRLSAETLTSGCPEGGCGGCALARADAPGCTSKARTTSGRGPVLVTLRRPT